MGSIKSAPPIPKRPENKPTTVPTTNKKIEKTKSMVKLILFFFSY
ncbi:MAG: hypothetical protein AB1782_19740 [Cyanobacteriota bacterium]